MVPFELSEIPLAATHQVSFPGLFKSLESVVEASDRNNGTFRHHFDADPYT